MASSPGAAGGGVMTRSTGPVMLLLASYVRGPSELNLEVGSLWT